MLQILKCNLKSLTITEKRNEWEFLCLLGSGALRCFIQLSSDSCASSLQMTMPVSSLNLPYSSTVSYYVLSLPDL